MDHICLNFMHFFFVLFIFFFFFFFKQKTAYEISACLVGSEMCIRDRIGATPWATDFYGANGFAVCDVSLGVSKDIKITDSFSLPLFAKATWNPRSEGAYFVVGLSF